MPDFITLTCPSCGGKLQITPDIERFACVNCGNEHIVNRSVGIVTLTPVIKELKKVTRGVDNTASELAIARLNEELNKAETEKAKLSTDLKNSYISTAMMIIIIIGGIIAFNLDCKTIAWILTIFGVLGLASQIILINNKKADIEVNKIIISDIAKEKKSHLRRVKNVIEEDDDE